MACAAARSPAEQDRFICIYPAYLNNKKTIAEGRRIPINKKNKMYSREWNRDVQYRGRVRVQLKQEDGSLCLVQFPSRKPLRMRAGVWAGYLVQRYKHHTFVAPALKKLRQEDCCKFNTCVGYRMS
ncbi:signal recognition particle 19 kDa protein isoform X1 [Acomys russatus]|uniref:signal recognition particle 19 kDa protein isoform X1 n=1 Tax=Acomys russatus TaxID=60746 RepID=UPI0021E2CC55|nr:signal recognition particle 19 kDa protein isoform X1 [Acomys russatus]